MNSRIVLILGTGRCGLTSVVQLLNRQPHAKVSMENAPLLPWKVPTQRHLIAARFERFRRERGTGLLGDAGSFYLPYVEEAVRVNPDVRIIALRRPKEEVVASFNRFLDEWNPLPIHHWCADPLPGSFHDPLWTRCFPQYELTDRTQGLRRYVDEYDRRLLELGSQFPTNLRTFDMKETLNTEAGQRALLEFADVPSADQVLVPNVRGTRTRGNPDRPFARKAGNHPLDPARCAVLVPYLGFIHPPCENGLRELEKRGYPVRRVGGFSAIDQGRNQMATDALLDGFEETMWIDSDVEFHPDAVDQLRAQGLPISCGIYAQKGRKALACHVMPGSSKLVFGRNGGLQEVLYAGAGFLHVRRTVYQTIQSKLDLPVMNERFASAMVPWFQSLRFEIDDGYWYQAEDYAFCQRARECGFHIMADTSIRLWHHGSYGYGWEDSGMDRERVGTFSLYFPSGKSHPMEGQSGSV